MRWPAKAEEFTNFVNQSIAPESGLPPMTVDMLKRWSDWGIFHHAPVYYRDDFNIALALLRNEADLRQRLSSPLAQPAQAPETGALEGAFQRGIAQVVSCVGSGLIEEQLMIQGLKDTGLIGSAGQIAVNFYPFSGKPIEIPSAGAEAKEGDALIIEIQDSGELKWGPAMTPLGEREFTTDDTVFRTLRSLSERQPELLSETEGKISAETAKGMNLPWPPERSKASAPANNKPGKQFARSLFTFPIFVPVMAIKGTRATIVESVYIAPNGQRIPPTPRHETSFPSRLYPAFLNTDGRSIQKIVNFIISYGLTLRFKFSRSDDPQRIFCAEQQKMRQLLTEAHNGNLRFEDIQPLSPRREDALVEQDFVEALFLTPDYADYISEVRRACSPEEQKSKFLPIRRYYSWLDYMWAEILEDIGRGLIPPLCKGGCGRILSPTLERERGRKREYCPDCELKRSTERSRQSRLRKRRGNPM